MTNEVEPDAPSVGVTFVGILLVLLIGYSLIESHMTYAYLNTVLLVFLSIVNKSINLGE